MIDKIFIYKGRKKELTVYKIIQSVSLNSFPNFGIGLNSSFSGEAEIHSDIFSESAVLKTYHNMEASTEEDLINMGQPPGGFTSNSGLFIYVKKPLERGHFHFTYGVYKQMRNARDGEYCIN